MAHITKNLQLAVNVGNALKPDYRIGSKFYALWSNTCDGGNAILEWVAVQIHNRYPELRNRGVSIAGVALDMASQPGIFTRKVDIVLVNKKRFKAALKKYAYRNLI